MSGHSKWANIKNKKAKTDAAKGKIFTKIGRELAVAAKAGADPSTNSKLADVIAKAKAANMPNDNITRSIKKAAGELRLVLRKQNLRRLRSGRQCGHRQNPYRQLKQNGRRSKAHFR